MKCFIKVTINSTDEIRVKKYLGLNHIPYYERFDDADLENCITICFCLNDDIYNKFLNDLNLVVVERELTFRELIED